MFLSKHNALFFVNKVNYFEMGNITWMYSNAFIERNPIRNSTYFGTVGGSFRKSVVLLSMELEQINKGVREVRFKVVDFFDCYLIARRPLRSSPMEKRAFSPKNARHRFSVECINFSPSPRGLLASTEEGWLTGPRWWR
jgi:hypothetical protein